MKVYRAIPLLLLLGLTVCGRQQAQVQPTGDPGRQLPEALDTLAGSRLGTPLAEFRSAYAAQGLQLECRKIEAPFDLECTPLRRSNLGFYFQKGVLVGIIRELPFNDRPSMLRTFREEMEAKLGPAKFAAISTDSTYTALWANADTTRVKYLDCANAFTPSLCLVSIEVATPRAVTKRVQYERAHLLRLGHP